MTIRTISVDLGERSYPVLVGRGARHELSRAIASSVRRIAIVTQAGVPQQLVPQFDGKEVHRFEIGNGEEHKSMVTVEQICREMSRLGFSRNDCVVGVGGGMVTDVAGFVASVYHRGVPVFHVATTLLAMVDAAIGGKTGVNIPEGKNLIGAYWQPHGVACDTDALLTLPPREMRCGYGEMAKYEFIARERLSEMNMTDRITRCIEIKSAIVADDERESGNRALLNYGHTLAHAVEIESAFEIAHGEAVAIGLLYAAHLAEVMGRITGDRVDDHYRVVREVYQLSCAVPGTLTAERAIELMARDKKALGSLTFILDGKDGLEIVDDVSELDIRSALLALNNRLAGG